jgi:hypothetical protein
MTQVVEHLLLRCKSLRSTPTKNKNKKYLAGYLAEY